MKILMVSADYLPYIGGIASHIYNLSKSLLDLGTRIVILTTLKTKKKSVSFFLKGADEIFQKRDGILEYHIPYPHIIFKGGTYGRSVIESWLIRSLIMKYKFDIIHWHSYYEDYQSLKLINNIPKIFTNHSSMFIKEFKIDPEEAKSRFFFSDIVITPSNELKQKTKILGYPEDRIFYIPNGVDTRRFCPNTIKRNILRSKLGIKKEDIAVLCARRFVEKNGIHILLDAVQIIKKRLKEKMESVVFIFVGNGKGGYSGYENDMIERCKLLKNKGLNIKLLGKIPYKEIPDIYRIADISIVPSLIEATSLTVLESLSTAISVVASNIPGVNDIIEDKKTGILFEGKNSKELAEEICSLILDGRRREYLGNSGRKYVVQHFEWKIVAKKTLEVYKYALSNFQQNAQMTMEFYEQF